MPVGQDEPVAVGPVGIARVVAHHPRVQDVGEGRQRHGRARMAAVGPLGGVHREPTDDIDAQLFKLRIGHDCQTTRPEPFTGSRNREVSAVKSAVHRRG